MFISFNKIALLTKKRKAIRCLGGKGGSKGDFGFVCFNTYASFNLPYSKKWKMGEVPFPLKSFYFLQFLVRIMICGT